MNDDVEESIIIIIIIIIISLTGTDAHRLRHVAHRASRHQKSSLDGWMEG
jgi:hypothetical protein